MNRSVEDGSHINDESPKYPYSNQYNQYYKNPIGINQFERKQAPWAKLRAIFIFILVLFLIGIYLGCFIGGSRLESFYFTYDSEAEIDENLIDTLYNNLDQDSRLNITNETYSLLLVIQDLDFIQRFDYLFVITGGNITNLRIAPRNGINRVSSFESRGSRNPYNLSIEFRINSTDPDISNVLVFPPDNVINGNLSTMGYHPQLNIELDEGEDEDDNYRNESLILPYNHRIIAVAEFSDYCPFT